MIGKLFRKYKFAKKFREKSVSQMLPYLHHCTDDVVINKNGAIFSVIKVGGFSFETADDDMLDIKKHTINNLVKSISDSSFVIYVHTFRKKNASFPGGDFNQKFTQKLNEKYKAKNNPENTFINEHYITILKKKQLNLSSFTNILNFFNKKEVQAQNKKQLQEDIMALGEIRDRILNGMNSYKTKLLGIRKERDGQKYSEITEFLGSIMNLGFPQKVKYSTKPISQYINTQRLFFYKNTIETLGTAWHKYAGIVSLKEYRPSTHAGMLDNFLKLPFEFVATQSFSFIQRGTAIAKIQLQQRRLVQSDDVATSQIEDINRALDEAMSGTFSFGDHHMTIMPIVNSKKKLDDALSQCVVEFANIGVTANRETLNMEASFWAQFPGNEDFIVRKSTINSLNFAGYASFHNYPSGSATGNHWGDAITVFNTTSGTTYFFNFHARDVGHTMIIGPTGAGKTVLLNFLTAQAQKYNPKTFFFDKDRGAELFIRGVGGKYTKINPGEKCLLNPLLLEDTNSNRIFLSEWLATLVTPNGEILSPADLAKIDTAIDGNYRLPTEQRTLSNIAPFLGLEDEAGISARLKPWYGKGTKAKIFDNTEDIIDFDQGSVFGFDMNEILKDSLALGPVLIYLFHKISLSLDGTPTMIILDEAWALIDNDVFAPRIKDWLKVLRKLNAFVVFATQSVEDAASSQISDTLIQQCATQIFLPNLRATSVYMDVFMLTAREYYLIKNTDPSTRFFLLKQDVDSVVAKLDLSGLEDEVNILSGRAETLGILDKLRQSYGDNPDVWLDMFMEQVKAL